MSITIAENDAFEAALRRIQRTKQLELMARKPDPEPVTAVAPAVRGDITITICDRTGVKAVVVEQPEWTVEQIFALVQLALRTLSVRKPDEPVAGPAES